jgi:hypothetical protein
VGLGSHFGFQEFHGFGYDFCYPKDSVDMSAKDDEGRPKYYTVSPDQGMNTYISTGELIAAAQDTQQIFPMMEAHGMTLKMYGEGFGQHLWKMAFGGRDLTRKDFGKTYG